MKLLYKPFAIVAGIVATRLGKRAFQRLWQAIDGSPRPPAATSGEAPLGKVAAAAALEGATMAAVAAAVDRLSARAFRHVFGAWPEKPAAEPERQPEAAAGEAAEAPASVAA
jgi:Protein of unknown function (DUF4235)